MWQRLHRAVNPLSLGRAVLPVLLGSSLAYGPPALAGEICPIDCDDGNACTDDLCGGPQGCVFTAVVEGTACDDGSALSTGDRCVGGVCQGRVEDLLGPLEGCTAMPVADLDDVASNLACLSDALEELARLEVLSPDLLEALRAPLLGAAALLPIDPVSAAQELADAAGELSSLANVGPTIRKLLVCAENELEKVIEERTDTVVVPHPNCPCCCRLKKIKGPMRVDLSDLSSPCDQVEYRADLDCGECGSVKDIVWVKFHPTQPARLRACQDSTKETTGAFGKEQLKGTFECDLGSFLIKAPFCQVGTHKLCATVYTECRRAPCDNNTKICPRATTCEPTKEGYKCIDIKVVETF